MTRPVPIRLTDDQRLALRMLLERGGELDAPTMRRWHSGPTIHSLARRGFLTLAPTDFMYRITSAGRAAATQGGR